MWKNRNHSAVQTALWALLITTVSAKAQPLPPPPVPPVNPITEEKRALGKLLFWDEQLSSDNTMACGTCHIPQFNGRDPRLGVNPGLDAIFGTPDDVFGSRGVIRSDGNNNYSPDPEFGLLPQVTNRRVPTMIGAAFAPQLFWDGRAGGQFVNPQSGAVSIIIGGSLESQSVAPPTSDVEMAHENRNWTQIAVKLAAVQPMVLASDLPPDLAAALNANSTYPELFDAAFGDPAITAERIAFSIATYERTLIADQTPWDAFIAGNPGALTPNQQQGWNNFIAGPIPCRICHTPPVFTNHTFRNLGLRPVPEDIGRQAVTGNPADRGRFKVPTLRNVGLKPRFMHNGMLTSLNQVLDFYAAVNGQVQFPDNRDPLLPIPIPPPIRGPLIDFLANGLTDPRVAAELFPFDRPMLHSERVPTNPEIIGAGSPGTGGLTPIMIANCPPNAGNDDYKMGIAGGLGAAQAFLAVSSFPPQGAEIVPDELLGPFVLGGAGPGTGFATWQWPIGAAPLNGCDVYLQWQVTDPAGPGGIATSPVAHLTLFPTQCPGDLNRDGLHNGLDIQNIVNCLVSMGANCSCADTDGNGILDAADAAVLVTDLLAGNDCP